MWKRQVQSLSLSCFFCFSRKDGKFSARKVDGRLGCLRTLDDIWRTPFGKNLFDVKDGETLRAEFQLSRFGPSANHFVLRRDSAAT
jgi:hypothetical protein